MIRPPVDPLRLKIRDITDEGVDFDVTFDRRFLADTLDGLDADLERCAATTHVHVNKFGENVFVRGSTVADLAVPCSRCLVPTVVHVEIPVRVTYAPEDADEETFENLEDDEEFAHHDRKHVDLTEVLREGLILGVPMTPLCSDGCKGICPVCGVDRNTTPCDCSPTPPDPRFAGVIEKLRALKLS